MNAKEKQAMFHLMDDLKTSIPTNSVVVVNRLDLEEAVGYMFRNGEEWSNQSAFGYAIAAAESIGMSEKDIKNLVCAMYSEFDERTLDSAAEIYRKSDY